MEIQYWNVVDLVQYYTLYFECFCVMLLYS